MVCWPIERDTILVPLTGVYTTARDRKTRFDLTPQHSDIRAAQMADKRIPVDIIPSTHYLQSSVLLSLVLYTRTHSIFTHVHTHIVRHEKCDCL